MIFKSYRRIQRKIQLVIQRSHQTEMVSIIFMHKALREIERWREVKIEPDTKMSETHYRSFFFKKNQRAKCIVVFKRGKKLK